MLHLWSLGIEEQFYIVWPLVLLLFRGRRGRLWWIGAIGLTSFAISLWISPAQRDWFFYSPIPRAWELLVGGFLAAWTIERGNAQGRRWPFLASTELRALAGLILIGLGSAFLSKTTVYPGVFALLPVAGAALLIMSPGSVVNRLLLSNRVAVGIGLISYPLYLWHWPLLSFLHIVRNGEPTLVELALTILAAFVLAWATFRFVEKPIRHQIRFVPALTVGLAAIGLIGLVTTFRNGFDFRFPPEIREIAALPPKNNAGFRKHCFLEGEDASQFDRSCIESGDGPLLFLWGDSTAAGLYPGLKKLQGMKSFRIAQFTSGGCPPILKQSEEIRQFCNPLNDRAFDFIRQSSPDVVLLQAMWNQVVSMDELRRTLDTLKRLPVRRIIILGPVPYWKRGLPNVMVNYFRARHIVADRLSFSVSGADIDAVMERFATDNGVQYVSAWRVFCNDEGCLTRVGRTADGVVASDQLHLSKNGSEYLIEAIAKDLFPD